MSCLIDALAGRWFCMLTCRAGAIAVLLRCLRRCLLHLGAATLTAMLLRRPIGLDGLRNFLRLHSLRRILARLAAFARLWCGDRTVTRRLLHLHGCFVHLHRFTL